MDTGCGIAVNIFYSLLRLCLRIVQHADDIFLEVDLYHVVTSLDCLLLKGKNSSVGDSCVNLTYLVKSVL